MAKRRRGKLTAFVAVVFVIAFAGLWPTKAKLDKSTMFKVREARGFGGAAELKQIGVAFSESSRVGQAFESWKRPQLPA